MPRLAHLSPNTQGIVLLLTSLLLFTLMDAMAKALVAGYPVMQVFWWRNAGQFLLIAAVFHRHLPAIARTTMPGLQVLRAVAQITTGTLFFLSLTGIGLAEATAIADVSPVFITLGAALLFRERLGSRKLISVGAALAGSMIIIRPGSAVFTPYALLALGTAISYAAFILLTRHMRDDTPWRAMIWSSGLATILLGVAVPPVWTPPATADLPLFLGLVLFGSGGQFFVIRAFSMAEASVIAPFGYVGIVFATLWGLLFFGEMPDLATGIGAAIIAAAGLSVWRGETRVARRVAP